MLGICGYFVVVMFLKGQEHLLILLVGVRHSAY